MQGRWAFRGACEGDESGIRTAPREAREAVSEALGPASVRCVDERPFAHGGRVLEGVFVELESGALEGPDQGARAHAADPAASRCGDQDPVRRTRHGVDVKTT